MSALVHGAVAEKLSGHTRRKPCGYPCERPEGTVPPLRGSLGASPRFGWVRSPILKMIPVIVLLISRVVHEHAFPATAQVQSAQGRAVTRTFTFYETSGHTEKRTVTQEYCLEPGTRVTGWKLRDTTRNGEGSGVIDVRVPEERANCVVLTARIQGKGERKIGGLVVDRLGRGWLGLEITVSGLTGAQKPPPREGGGTLPSRQVPPGPLSVPGGADPPSLPPTNSPDQGTRLITK